MESKVDLKIEVTVEPGTVVFKYNEESNWIESLRVIETHIVKVPWIDEYGNRDYRSCLNKQWHLKPSYVEMVMVVDDDNSGKRDVKCYPLKDVWLTPEEAMNAYSEYQLSKFKTYHKE